MKYTGPIYRPPIEHDTLLLQVTVGCAHNKCTFCTMYRSVEFEVEQMAQIENDLNEAKKRYSHVNRIFLVNGDAFVLSTNRLKQIAKKIIEYFPGIQTITMYASVQNIISKTDGDLKELHDLKINDLYVGLESGTDKILERLNKGHTIKDAIEQLKRLNKANIDHISLLMLGVGGSGNGLKNAQNTAILLNTVKPKAIILCTLGVFPGSELERKSFDGGFTPATELEILAEEMKLIESLELEEVPFYGTHPINAIPVYGVLPKDQAKMISLIEKGIQKYGKTALSKSIRRTSL